MAAMTVRDLLAALQGMDPDAEILIDVDEEFVSLKTIEPSDPPGAVVFNLEED